MFFIMGMGKTTKQVAGQMFERTCNFCNQTHTWQLCKNKKWFTLFFIPVFPYSTYYSISCPNCGSYMEISAEQFNAMKADLNKNGDNDNALDKLKYAGKNQVQINYLKQMEEMKNKNNSN